VSLPAGWIVPDWPAPSRVRAFVTTREGGVSEGNYASMNLGASSGDDSGKVARNRLIVRGHMPRMARWMKQVHGTTVAELSALGEQEVAVADAAVTQAGGEVAVVLTADCMPVFFADRAGKRAAVAHAGWRGLAAGVLESTLRSLQAPPSEVIAWMGPAIGPEAFEVGPEVKQAFEKADRDAGEAFRAHKPAKFMADLYALARRRLAQAGVTEVHGGGFCTYHETERFFSYRRVQQSGRMGAFIWIEP
jgi:YfiH family protein